MVVSEQQVLAWLGSFVWPFLRVTGLFLTAPVFSSSLIPAQVKALLVLALSFALALWVPDLPPFPNYPAAAVVQIIVQISVGAAIGLINQIMVYSVAGAGEIAGLSIGFSFAVLQFRDASGESQALYNLFFWLGLMGYIALGGPVWTFAALAHSFAGGELNGISFSNWHQLALFGGSLLTSAVMLAAPILAVALCINLSVGLLTVFAPQLNLLSVGFPMLILAGLATLTLSLAFYGGPLQSMSEAAARAMALMLAHG